MGILLRILITITFLFIGFTPCFSDLKEARNIYEKGDLEDAFLEYENWLLNNHKSSNFSSVLFEFSELRGNIYKISEVLEKQIIFVSDIGKRKELYIKLAQLFELSFNLHKAQVYYQKAALVRLDEIDYELLLSSSIILILEGELILAESQVQEIIIKASDQIILKKAKILFTIIKILNSGSGDIDYNSFSLDKSETIYLMYLIAQARSEIVMMDQLSKKLEQKFPSSPEANLIRNELSELPNLISSLGLLNGKIIIDKNYNYIIQTGSFQDPENAHYLSIDLAEKGFVSKIEEQIINDKKYYKVLMYFPNQDEMQQVLKLLKENGFEGFPVY